MMFLSHFEYFAPGTATEAFDLLRHMGSRAKVLAGGTDLFLMMKEKLIKPECLLDINGITDFQGIFYTPGKGATIGAATKITEVEHSAIIREKYYALHQATGELGSVQVRNMATVGGNSCHASPAAETPVPLIALGAKVVLSNGLEDRELPLEDFILGNRQTALEEGELLTRFVLPEPQTGSASRYTYIGLRKAMEIDTVNMAVNLVLEADRCTVKKIRLVMGAVAPKPLIVAGASSILEGHKFSVTLASETAAAASVEARPISDIRASGEYRRQVVAVLARRLLQEVFEAAAQEVL